MMHALSLYCLGWRGGYSIVVVVVVVVIICMLIVNTNTHNTYNTHDIHNTNNTMMHALSLYCLGWRRGRRRRRRDAADKGRRRSVPGLQLAWDARAWCAAAIRAPHALIAHLCVDGRAHAREQSPLRVAKRPPCVGLCARAAAQLPWREQLGALARRGPAHGRVLPPERGAQGLHTELSKVFILSWAILSWATPSHSAINRSLQRSSSEQVYCC